MSSINDKEKLARLRLIRTENIGPVTFQRLIDRFTTAERALDALPDMAARGGKTSFTPYPEADARREAEATYKFGAKMIFRGTPEYPALLAEVDDAPPVLTVLGDIAMLSRKGLGIVGSRNASLAGRKLTETLSQKVAEAGYIITSGLARGIDSAAHQQALTTGTIAVVAGGIDVVYPRENEKLYRDIAAQGAIVAESPFGTEPLARHFPRRNRIISGLSLGVLVMEAAEKSGSLITARMAVEQNREVFAVPGSPLDPRAGGTNALIKDGAHMTTCADDILSVLNSLRHSPLRDQPAAAWDGPDSDTVRISPDAKLYDQVVEQLSYTPVSVDELIRSMDVPAAYVLTILLELEIAGRVERHRGNTVSLAG